MAHIWQEQSATNVEAAKASLQRLANLRVAVDSCEVQVAECTRIAAERLTSSQAGAASAVPKKLAALVSACTQLRTLHAARN